MIIDTHAHLDELDNLDEALAEARECGITAIIAVGSNHQSNLKVMEISHKHSPFIYPALGLHPCDLSDLKASQIDYTLKHIEEMASDIVAIGEIGLDYDKRVTKVSPKEQQKEVLKRLLAIAREYEKPAIIHSRYAWKDCFELTKEARVNKVIFHWFTGFSSVLRDILNAGYFISATPAAEYHQEHRRAIKETPLEKLLLETDCPVVYGRETKYRSAPVDILKSLRAVAALKGVDEDITAEQTTYNAAQLFNITPH